MRKLDLWLFLLCILTRCGLTARILAMFPFPGKSRHIFTTAIMKALAERGHQIVEYLHYSPFPPSEAIPNHTHFEIHSEFEMAFGK